jgi:predicted nucleotidyltransferase
MNIYTPTLISQKEFSLKQLEMLKTGIKDIEELAKYNSYSIYVTGSYGRLEATQYSDLDLFFITSGKRSNPISQLSKTLIDADLIRLTEKMGFPPFSNDGQFLDIHYLDDIVDQLGSRNDDFSNFFTARLLLLLESAPLYNEAFYDESVSRMIQTYYRDYL